MQIAGAGGAHGVAPGHEDGGAHVAAQCSWVADVERQARAIHAERLARASRDERIADSYRRLVRAILGGPVS